VQRARAPSPTDWKLIEPIRADPRGHASGRIAQREIEVRSKKRNSLRFDSDLEFAGSRRSDVRFPASFPRTGESSFVSRRLPFAASSRSIDHESQSRRLVAIIEPEWRARACASVRNILFKNEMNRPRETGAYFLARTSPTRLGGKSARRGKRPGGSDSRGERGEVRSIFKATAIFDSYGPRPWFRRHLFHDPRTDLPRTYACVHTHARTHARSRGVGRGAGEVRRIRRRASAVHGATMHHAGRHAANK